MLRLASPTQPYPWGSTTAIPAILGVAPTGDPVAELWLGAHPSAPSRVIGEGDGGGEPLDRLLRDDPQANLGPYVTGRYGAVLPYLLKVLAADAPLSLQVHPTIDQARVGFDAEEAAGVPLASPERSYRDRNHKPELLYALEPFEGLCGFRTPRRAAELLEGLGTGLALELAALLVAGAPGAALRSAVGRLLGGAPPVTPAEVDEVAQACRARLAAGSPAPDTDRTVVRLAEAYPGDPGVVMALLLNHVRLAPGEAVFVPAGAVHAYLQGVAIEIMSNSDNVLRAGLTTKHVDVAELLTTIEYAPGPPTRIGPEPAYGATEVFSPPVDDFVLSVTTVHGDAEQRMPGGGPRILLCLEGKVVVTTAAGESEVLDGGDSAFVPVSDGELSVRGTGRLVQADVG